MERPRPPADAAGRSRNNFPRNHATYVINIIEHNDKYSERRRFVKVNATAPEVPQAMDWSMTCVTWGPADHPEVMPSPGTYALLLDTIIVTDQTCLCSPTQFSSYLIYLAYC